MRPPHFSPGAKKQSNERTKVKRNRAVKRQNTKNTMNSSSWIQLTQSREEPFFYFRRVSMYQYDDNDKSPMTGHPLVASCGQSGLLALTERPDPHMRFVSSSSISSQPIRIVSANGRQMAEIAWSRDRGHIVAMGWTQEMKLIIVSEHGQVAVFDVHGRMILEHTIEQFLRDYEHVAQCRIVHNIVAVFTTRGCLHVAHDVLQSRANRVEEHLDYDEQTDLSSLFVKYPTVVEQDNINMINCMEIMPPWLSLSGELEILLCPDNAADIASVIVATHNTIEPLELNCGPVSNIRLSPDGTTIALYCDDREENDFQGLIVFPADFSQRYLEFNTGTCTPPEQLVYCGGECILIYWAQGTLAEADDSSLLLMVDCYGESTAHQYDSTLYLHQDVDCALIFSSMECELLERIHSSTVAVFRIGSLESSALLFDAYSEYLQSNPTALRTIGEIQSRNVGINAMDMDTQSVYSCETLSSMPADALQNAVDQCIEAACHEYDTHVQQKLLLAACFGKSFLAANRINENIHGVRSNVDHFARQCQIIQVLNELRHKDNGIPLTYQQLLFVEEPTLLARLANLHRHFLAIKIAERLQLSPAQILLHWACAKVQHSTTANEKEIFDAIHHKLVKYESSVSYAQIAHMAYKTGKKELAIRLLGMDSHAIDQIPLYLSMNETNLALRKAIESNDTDLLYTVILYMEKHFDQDHMFDAVEASPETRRLFLNYFKQHDDLGIPFQFHKMLQEHRETAIASLSIAYKSNIDDEEHHMADHGIAMENFHKAGKKCKTDTRLTEEQVLLLRLQRKLEEMTSRTGTFVGSSLHDTLVKCVLLGLENRAEKLRDKFHVSDRRWWMIRLKAYTMKSDWEALFKLSVSRRNSPIGYEPFVEACLEAKPDPMNEEAMRYIPHVKDLRRKIDYLIEMLKFKEAIETAAAARDTNMLRYIRTRTKNTRTMQTIDSVMHQLS